LLVDQALLCIESECLVLGPMRALGSIHKGSSLINTKGFSDVENKGLDISYIHNLGMCCVLTSNKVRDFVNEIRHLSNRSGSSRGMPHEPLGSE
jgi:hypothetical protein